MNVQLDQIWNDLDNYSALFRQTTDYKQLRRPATEYKKKIETYRAQASKIVPPKEYKQDHENIKLMIDELSDFADTMLDFSTNGNMKLLDVASRHLDVAGQYYKSTTFYHKKEK
jgi:hypothetical protein